MTNLKCVSICFGDNKNGKTRKNSKNTPAQYFMLAQGKTEITWGSQLMICSGAVAYDWSIQILEKLIV